MLLEDFLKQFDGLDPKSEIKFRKTKYNGDPIITNSLIIDDDPAYIRKEDGPKYIIDDWNWEESEEFNFKVLVLG
jgi:hypothetical protein